MTPYYEQDGITIYYGDCREVLPSLDPDGFGVMLTDPPYGLDHVSQRSSHMFGEMARYREKIANDGDLTVRDDALSWWGSRPALVFGTWKQPPPTGTRAVLIWDKGEASGMGDLSIPWKPSWEMIYLLGDGFSGRRTGAVLRAYVPPRVAMGRLHPNQKPSSLIEMLLPKAPKGAVIDPFMGSGSTLHAAKILRREAVGIEIEERYCEIAASRLAQGVLAL